MKKQSTRVLVTGANGFVGSYVVRELLKQSYAVCATSSDIFTGKRFEWFDSVEKRQMDLAVLPDDVYDFFDRPDILIHLAWGGLPNYKKLFHIERNLFESYFFIKKMTEGGLRHLSVTGTCFEYGMKEGCLKEDMPTAPCTSYSLAKDTLRKFIQELAKEYSLDWKWIRLFYLYGEGQAKNSILEQLKTALVQKAVNFPMSGGEQERDYLPIEKAAEYIVKISTQSRHQGIFNCCSGEPISIRNLVEEYLIKTKQAIKLDLGRYPYPDYEPMAFWGDNTKLKEVKDER
ncbi:MAG: NAD-dependent epimerase/dehydratase family protein [Candidatus Omnitrophota bacterium]